VVTFPIGAETQSTESILSSQKDTYSIQNGTIVTVAILAQGTTSWLATRSPFFLVLIELTLGHLRFGFVPIELTLGHLRYHIPGGFP
jgi:hypothetical protein